MKQPGRRFLGKKDRGSKEYLYLGFASRPGRCVVRPPAPNDQKIVPIANISTSHLQSGPILTIYRWHKFCALVTMSKRSL